MLRDTFEILGLLKVQLAVSFSSVHFIDYHLRGLWAVTSIASIPPAQFTQQRHQLRSCVNQNKISKSSRSSIPPHAPLPVTRGYSCQLRLQFPYHSYNISIHTSQPRNPRIDLSEVLTPHLLIPPPADLLPKSLQEPTYPMLIYNLYGRVNSSQRLEGDHGSEDGFLEGFLADSCCAPHLGAASFLGGGFLWDS